MLSIFALASLVACDRTPDHVEPKASDPPRQDTLLFIEDTVDLNQGWTEETEAAWAFADEGGRWIRYDWFLALEQKDSEALFRDNRHLASYRLMPARASALNPDALPVGITKNTDAGTGLSYMGITCAACHNSYLRAGDKLLQIDGGASLFNINGLMAGIAEAASATLADGAKFDRFAARVLGDKASDATEKGALRGALEVARDGLQRRVDYATPAAALGAGYGRLDAFGFVMNETGAIGLGLPQNAKPTDAPASYPFMWTTPRQSLVEWPASSSNALPLGFGPLTRNATQAIGALAMLDFQERGALGYDSSVNFANLSAIEDWIIQLHPPKWPATLLGELDAEKVAAGSALYQASCLSCHPIYQGDEEKGGLKVGLTPVAEVGTDPTLVKNLTERVSETGPLQGKRAMVVVGDPFGPTASSLDIAVNATLGAILRHPEESIRSGVGALTHSPFQTSKDYVYKAGPLAGIWATAPFLHNGSVPTLAQLLSPPEQREAVWYQGTYDYDPVAVGYLTAQSETNDFKFDTALTGNSNSGHRYGTALSADERAQLIEYLKSL